MKQMTLTRDHDSLVELERGMSVKFVGFVLRDLVEPFDSNIA